MKTQKVLGIMSGTSLDGVDYALCEIGPRGIVLKNLWRHSYPAALKARLMKAADNQLTSYEVAQLHHDLGRFYADKAPHVKCDYVGLHGQTIFHNPDRKRAATYQIGEPTYLSLKLGVPVINQFRNMDLALGGQGAPLATLFHRAVFSHDTLNVAVNNLGGISNVTYLPAHAKKILSFDTGPANMLIDLAVTKLTRGKMHFDIDGLIGERGIPSGACVEKWMKHEFLKQGPPKSTGREEFGHAYFEKISKEAHRAGIRGPDFIATLVEFAAVSVADAYAHLLPVFPDLVVLAGGGAANPYLVSRIRFTLREAQWKKLGEKLKRPVEVTTTDAFGWPSQSIEAAAFALLAYRTQNNLSGNIPQTTGASRPAILGQITPAP